MKNFSLIFFLFLLSNSLAFAMDAPTDNQIIDYAPIVAPVSSNAPETAFPMGLGSVADDGGLLDLVVGIDGFNTPVDLYLGIYAPAIDPGDLYLFTETGSLQGLNATGLVPWMQNRSDPVSATVLSAIPTAALPQGNYTFYLAVAPTGTLSPAWLWSTEYEYINPVKGIFVNTIKEDKLVMTAVDQNDLYYSFFGIKNDVGELQYFNQLILDQRDSKGNFEHYLSIDFDQYRRPVAIMMPDAGGRMLLDYISETQVSVSIVANDGSTEMVVVDNPYPMVDSRQAEYQSDLSVEKRDGLLRSTTTDNVWGVIGEITTCKDGDIPKVSVKRELDEQLLAAVPQLALITPTVSSNENGINGDFSYTYNLQGLADYNSWYKSCLWDWTGGNVIDTVENILTGILGSVVSTADTVYQLGSGLISDVKDGTVTNTALNVVDHYAEGVVPIWTYLRKVYDLGKLPVDLYNGPCSQQVWNFLNQVQAVKQTVTVTLKGVKRQKTFIPEVDYEDIASVYAPDFDFSDICGECGQIDNWVFEDAFFGEGFTPYEGYVVNVPDASNGLVYLSSPGTSLVASYSFRSWTTINLIIKSFESDVIAWAEFEQERSRTDDWFSEEMYEWIGADTYGYVYPGDHEEGLVDTATMIAAYRGNTINIVDVGLTDLEARSEIVKFYNQLLAHAKALIDRKCDGN